MAKPAFFVCLLASGLGCSEPRSQGPTWVDCVDCSLNLRTVAILGRNGPGISPLGTVIEDHAGRFFVSDIIRTSAVQLYSRTGTYLGTSGRGGRGPGEFQTIGAMALASDSLHVFDLDQARETIIDLKTGQVSVRNTRPNTHRALRVGSTMITIAPPRHTDPTTRMAIHALSEDGVSRSFREIADDVFGHAPLAVTTAGPDAIWIADRNRYTLERWSTSGELLEVVERDADWFPAHKRLPFRQDLEPYPLLWDIYARDQLLIVAIHVPDARWREQFRDAPSPDMTFNGDYSRYFDTIIEVLDVPGRRIVGRERFDEYFAGFTNRGKVLTYAESADGDFIVRVSQLEFD